MTLPLCRRFAGRVGLLKSFVVVILVFGSACGKDSNGSSTAAVTTRQPGAPAAKLDSAAGTVDLGAAAYSPGPMAASGTIAGTITLTGAPRVDTTPVTIDLPVCGNSAPGPVSATAKGLSNAVVWIADVKTGKALPADRRIDLSSEDCVLDPRVQGATVGTTVNVTNDDKLLHRLVYMVVGTRDTLTVMPFFNVGQVVASERLTKKSEIVEVRCALHPWTRAYIAVFDHPYFAVTGADGAFRIDSLPPGNYKLMIWHEGADKPLSQMVQVAAGGVARADVAMTVR